jgi:thiosulfate/3-mercaptopyruvate sulfurtransferase
MSRHSLPLLIEADQLEQWLASKPDNVLILDVCSQANYQQHHLPGAIHIDPKSLQCGTAPTPGKLPCIEQLNALFSAVGLNPEQHVIVYDDEGGGWAGRLIWTLDVIGHPHYSYLNGGLHSWKNEGHAIETTANQASPVDYRAAINPQPIASLSEIVEQLPDDKLAIWDARSAQEYDGRKVVAKHGGHIPGAVNLDWLELIDRQRNMRLVDLDALQQQINALGLSKDKTIITHCQTHHRSGLTYLAMKILDYPSIKGYDGSWSEWGNRDDTPIVTGSEPQPLEQH